MLDCETVDESIDFVLRQQFLSDTFCLIDRTKTASVVVAGAKAVHAKMLADIRDCAKVFSEEGENIDAFARALSTKFKVPEAKFLEKIKQIPPEVIGVDERLLFIQSVAVVREHYQDKAYKEVVSAIHAMLVGKHRSMRQASPEQVHQILFSQLNSPFSLIVNLHVLREWSKMASIPINFKGPWLSSMNKLVAATRKIIEQDGE